MPLINCPECNHECSSTATACPKCGYPITNAADAMAVGTQITTIQETSKRFKIHLIGAWALFITGIIMTFGADICFIRVQV